MYYKLRMMKKKLFLATMILAMSSMLMAGNEKTTSLNGQVIDASGNPVAGAKVLIEGLNKSVYTDFDGNFSLNKVPKETNTIQVSMISYEDQKSEIELNQTSSEFISIQLESK